MADFGARLKELRKGAGLTQEQLGEQAGLHKLTVAKLEQGIRQPSWATVLALADALRLSCEAFQVKPAPRPAMRPRPPPGKANPEGVVTAATSPGKAIGISSATAYRHWNYARAWLHGELHGAAES
jgi:transcriptional regulator with XRE-family HTH domain